MEGTSKIPTDTIVVGFAMRNKTFTMHSTDATPVDVKQLAKGKFNSAELIQALSVRGYALAHTGSNGNGWVVFVFQK